MARRCLDRYPLAPTVQTYVPLVLADLKELGKRGVPDAMRPCSVTLTAPADTDSAVVAALDTWVDLVACNGGGSSVILAEGRGGRKGTRHWHGLVVSWEPERLLAAWWCEVVPGAENEAQRIIPISSCCLPLGSDGMGKDIRQVLEYVFAQHTGTEIVARGWLRERWCDAEAAGPVAEASPSVNHGEAEVAPFPDRKSAHETGIGTASRERATREAPGRICEYCGRTFEGRRADAIYCCKSHRNMASRRNARQRVKAA